jgi:hypothetical protein
MPQIITRPGDGERDDPVLRAAYEAQDELVTARFQATIDELHAFANSDFRMPVMGFDGERYRELKRDARVVASDLARGLMRWRQGEH